MIYLIVFLIVIVAILATVGVDRLIEHDQKTATSGSRRGEDLL